MVCGIDADDWERGADGQVHKLTMLILRSLTMLSIADVNSIILVGQQSLVVPALVSILRRSAVKIWGVCAEDVDGREWVSAPRSN